MDKTALKEHREKTERIPSEAEMKTLEKVLEVQNENKEIIIKDGIKFIRDLRAEARRQKSIKTAEELELQGRDIEHVPSDKPNIAEEIRLSEEFEIIEE